MLILSMLLKAFQPPKPAWPKGYEDIRTATARKKLKVITVHERCTRDHPARCRKALSSMRKINIIGVLRLRATSAAPRHKSVRRFAQDDDFVEFLKNNIRFFFTALSDIPDTSKWSERLSLACA
jgi:hypothetical protein